eukprot:COSAG05_NODE_1247_length_5408_cov_3.141270_3_plen_497_part_00
MFGGGVPLASRTVGVLSRDDIGAQPGFTLLCAGREVYLIDLEGRVVHEWRSERSVFVAHLLPNGNLIRDGSDSEQAAAFHAGGAAGYVEEVTWENELVWRYSQLPYSAYLTHHDLEPMPNGHVLLLCWERVPREAALAAGRRPELLPDGEVWNNLTLEVAPDGRGGAEVVWKWSMWDHLVQDYNPDRPNFGAVEQHPELFDLNYCPAGGKLAARSKGGVDPSGPPGVNSFGWAPWAPRAALGQGSGTGEKDWLHANSVSYDAVRDQVLISLCFPSELLVVDHGTTTEEAASHAGGRRGKGGDVLWRYGNPQVYRMGTRMEQALFVQHGAHFIRSGLPGGGNVLVFNNGRAQDRLWSSVDELVLPEAEALSGEYQREDGTAFGPEEPAWRYGPRAGRAGSFYCTHMSAAQRLPNGNTLITLGPQGLLVEVTAAGQEVWRYLSPVILAEGGVSFVRQGDSRLGGRFNLFRAERYAPDYAAFAGRAEALVAHARRYLEA